jgi:hypothetical protein
VVLNVVSCLAAHYHVYLFCIVGAVRPLVSCQQMQKLYFSYFCTNIEYLYQICKCIVLNFILKKKNETALVQKIVYTFIFGNLDISNVINR